MCIEMMHASRYDLKDTSKVYLSDIMLLGAMGPPGGGRNPLNERFTRHFINISVNPFQDETMIRIFSVIMAQFFRVGITGYSYVANKS